MSTKRKQRQLERGARAAVQAAVRRGGLPGDLRGADARAAGIERARAALRTFRTIDRIQRRRDWNQSADLGGEA